jgi:hypothetical protein
LLPALGKAHTCEESNLETAEDVDLPKKKESSDFDLEI